MDQETKTKQENIVAGIVGAFLGSLVGVLCTILIGQLGYVASVSGLVMAVGALKGYELLGGRLSKKGAIISSVLVLVMTYLAHRLSWSVALMRTTGYGLFDCFQAIPRLLEAGALESVSYWGDLVMLYLFTLLGAVPTIIGGLRSTSMPDLPPSPTAASAAPERDTSKTEFYPGNIPQMRALRLSASAAMFVGLVPTIALILLGMSNGTSATFILAALGCLASALVMMVFALPNVRLCYDAMAVMVRVGGTVWKVNLTALNTADTYRFTKKNGAFRALRWDILHPEEQERAKASILRAIELLTSGQVMAGSALSLAVLPLTGLQIREETKWAWKGVYSAGGGKEKKITIAKAFPGFTPALGMEPVQSPVSARWSLLGVGLALTVVLGLVGAGIGRQIDGPGLHGGPSPSAPLPTHTAPSPTETPFDPLEQFHVGTELGYSYTAVGYIRAPNGMFGAGAFVDAHVPYSEKPEYLDRGYTIRSAAHGMEVTVTIAQPYEDAAAVVNAQYELFESTGADIYEASETQYLEEYDIAVKQVMYFENDRTIVRIAVLYADYKQDGHYLNACIVYQPELMDEEYPELLAELSDAYALNLPEIEPMESGQI